MDGEMQGGRLMLINSINLHESLTKHFLATVTKFLSNQSSLVKFFFEYCKRNFFDEMKYFLLLNDIILFFKTDQFD